MFNLGGMKQVFTRALGFGTLLIKRHAPEICTYTGIVLGAVAAGLACKQTLVFVEVLEDTKKKIETVHDLQAIQKGDPEGIVLDEDGENHTYTSEDAKRDLVTVYSQAAIQTVKIYALPVGLGLLSIGMILGGHRILRKENAAVTAAYMALSESFKQYRKRVETEVGPDKEREYMYGIKREEVLIQNEDGTTESKTVMVQGTDGLSMYFRVFDDTNLNCGKTPELSRAWLRGQQNYANDLLHAHGYLFLNTVYRMLGFPETEAGQIVGWIDGMGDSYVSFGMFDVLTPGYTNDHRFDTVIEDRTAFINGFRNSTILDFNVDGPILELFTKKPVVWPKQR